MVTWKGFLKTYYLLHTTQDPHCMMCKHAWSYDFMVSNFTQKFVNDDLKKHRRQQLYERELSMLPASQEAAEQYLQRKDMIVQVTADKGAALENYRKAKDDVKAAQQALTALRKQCTKTKSKFNDQYQNQKKVVDAVKENVITVRREFWNQQGELERLRIRIAAAQPIPVEEKKEALKAKV